LRQMMTVGCFARSLEDIRLCFSLIAGTDSDRPDVPPVPLDVPSGKALKDLKLAWLDELQEVPVHSEIRAAMQSVIQKLSETGMKLDRWIPDCFDLGTIWTLYGRMAAYINNYAQPKDRYNIRRSLTLLFRTATQGDKELRDIGNFGRFLPEILNPSLKGYFETLTERDRFTAELDQALEPWDAWIMPVAATPAFTHRPAWSAIEVNGKSYPHGIANGAYTIPFNLSGHPAIVIPIGQTQNGLPIGLQIVGKRWKEMELIAIAQELDSIVGTFQSPKGY